MTSFGLFSVNQPASHPHVSRTNFATALDAQDRLQKQHDPDAFKAAHPSGRLGRLLKAVPRESTSGVDTEEEPSPEPYSLERRILPESQAQEAGASPMGGPFIPIQPRQSPFPMMGAPVAPMFMSGQHQPGFMPFGVGSNPSQGMLQPRLLPRAVETRPQQQGLYVPLHPNLSNPPNSSQTPQVSQFPQWRASDIPLPLKRKRGRPRRVDPKNVMAAPLRPYPPPPTGMHASQPQIFLQSKPPPSFTQLAPQLAQSGDFFHPNPPSSIEGSGPQAPQSHNDDNGTPLRRKRGRPRKPDGVLRPLLSHAPLRDSPAQNGVLPNSHPPRGENAPQVSRAQEGLQPNQHNMQNEDAVRVSQPQNLNMSALVHGKGRAGIVELENSNTAPQLLDPSPSGQHATPSSNSHPLEEHITATQLWGMQFEPPQKRPRGRPRKSDTMGAVMGPLPVLPPDAQEVPQSQGEIQSGPLPPPLEHGEESQSYQHNSMQKTRGRPRKLDLQNPVATPLPSKSSYSRISEPEDDMQPHELPSPLEDVLPVSQQQLDAEPDPLSEHAPQARSNDLHISPKKPRGRPRKLVPSPSAIPMFEAQKDPKVSQKVSQSNLSVPGEHGLVSPSENQDLALPQQKPRGRPKKLDSIAGGAPFKASSSKEPDHPLQVFQSNPNQQGEYGYGLSHPSNDDILTPQKRPRGRPKKSEPSIIVLPFSPKGPDHFSQPSPPPPEDYPTQVSQLRNHATSAPEKKPRGRPRKVDPNANAVPLWATPPEEHGNISPSEERDELSQFPPENQYSPVSRSHGPTLSVPPKRKPGRPRKEDPAHIIAASLPVNHSSPEQFFSIPPRQPAPPGDGLKRKRGRPSKAGMDQTGADHQTSDVLPGSRVPNVAQTPDPASSIPLKRKRGRPSKADLLESTTVQAQEPAANNILLAPKPVLQSQQVGSSVPAPLAERRRPGRPKKVMDINQASMGGPESYIVC